MAALVLVTALAVAAGTTGAGGVVASQADDGQVDASVALASKTAWVEPEGELVLRLRLDGDDIPRPAALADRPAPGSDGDGEGPAIELVVTLHQRLTSRSAFALTLDGSALGPRLATTRAPLSTLGRDATGAVIVRLGLATPQSPPPDDDADRPRIVLDREGAYPVGVALQRGAEVLDDFVTHLIRLPDGDIEPLRLSLVVPLHARPDTRLDPITALDPRQRRRLSGLVAALEASAQADVVLAPTPETIGGLTRGDETSADLLGRIRNQAAGAVTLAGPYVPVDPLELLAADLEQEIDAQLTTGTDVLDNALRSPLATGTWLARTPLDATTITALRRAGIQRIVVDEATLEPLDRPLTLTQPFLLDGTTGRRTVVLAADRGLTEHLLGADDPVLAAHHFLTDAAVLYFDEPASTRAVVAQAPQEWSPPAALVETVLTGLASSPIIEMVGITDATEVPLARTADGDALVRRPLATEPPSATVFDAVPAIRTRLRSVATVAPPDVDPLLLAERQLLTAQSVDLSGGQQARLLTAAADTIDAVLDQVEIPSRRSVTLTARTGELPVTLRNDATWPMEVVVSLEADQLGFPQGSSRSVELPAGTNTTARFEVEARTSGAFPLQVRVTSPDGRLLLGQTRYTIRSTVVSGVGLALTGASVAFLVAWWGLHLHRGRGDKTDHR